jgi:hypothetical protein
VVFTEGTPFYVFEPLTTTHLFRRAGEFESNRQDEHHAAGIGEIYRMMAK